MEVGNNSRIGSPLPGQKISGKGPAFAMQRPNFVFFITDQQRFDHVGFAGNGVVKTPVIDRLAKEGSWFKRFYVSSPTCMSSRATLMTGRMPSLHGVRYNGVPLHLDSVTFVDALRAAGYQTALIGKSHIQGMQESASMVPCPPIDDRLMVLPETLREARREHHAKSDYSNEMEQVWARHRDQSSRVRLPYYGFDHVQFCLGHGDAVTGHYRDWLLEKSQCLPATGEAKALERSGVHAPQVYKPQVDENLYPTHFIAEKTTEYIDQHLKKESNEPFFIQCSFPDPHHPFTPPGHYYSMYSPEDVQLPQSFYTPSPDATPPLRHLWDEYHAGTKVKRWTYPFVTGEPEARDIVAKTYGQITMIDDAIGQVVDFLRERNLLDNTVICFLSDHGDYLGDHGLMLKGPMHYQSVIRVPFVWRDPDPRYNRGCIDDTGSILDIAKTVLNRAGINPYNGIQGVNLIPVLSGEQTISERDVIIEMTTQYPYLGFDDIRSVTTLVNDRWRLSVWQGCDWGELYDLQSDPHELQNLWGKADYAAIQSKLLLALVHSSQDHAETSPYPLSVS
jgi:arylsulfatase A-like enzyme